MFSLSKPLYNREASIAAAIANHSEAPSEAPPEKPAEQNPESAETDSKANSITETRNPESPDSEYSSKLLETARLERKLRARENELKKQEAKLQEQLKGIQEKESSLKNPKNIMDVLKAYGIKDPNDLQTRILSGELSLEAPEVDPIEEKFSSIQAENASLKEQLDKLVAEREKTAASQRYEAYKSDIKNSVSQYENLSGYFKDDVTDLVEEAEQVTELYYNKNGELPEPREVLEYLDSKYEKHYNRLQSLTSTQTHLPKETEQPVSKTLTHSDTQQSVADEAEITPTMVASGKVSRDEFLRRAMKKHGL